MVNWNWRYVTADPEDILTSARSLRMRRDWYEIDPTVKLTPSTEYLSWAHALLAKDVPENRDGALCYAKRAVCRDIDGFIICNHLGSFLRRDYPDKIKLLSEIGVSVPPVVHDLVIDPRNDVEHNYVIPDRTQAKHAVQIATLFIDATAAERERRAIISLACSITVCEQSSRAPGNYYDRRQFTLSREAAPMLLMDLCSESPLVMVLHPADEEVSFCPLRNFSAKQAIALATLLRQHYASVQSASTRGTLVDCDWLTSLKTQLGLLNIS